jgi:hypothetical protein
MFTHREPIWEDSANFIIRAAVDLGAGTYVDSEQLWAKKFDATHFELCCIPFFLRRRDRRGRDRIGQLSKGKRSHLVEIGAVRG